MKSLDSPEYHHCREEKGGQNLFRASSVGGGFSVGGGSGSPVGGGGSFCWRRNSAPTAIASAKFETSKARAVVCIIDAVPGVGGDVNVEHLAIGTT